MTRQILAGAAALVLGAAMAADTNAAAKAAIPAVSPADPRAWQPRFKEKLALAKKGDMRYVFLGDSITHYFEVTGKKVWDRYFGGPDAPYPALNLGFSGDRTEHLLWRIEQGELDGYEAKLIFLMIGTNNTFARWQKETVFETCYAIRRILGKIREKQPKATVVLHPIFPRGTGEEDIGRVYNNAVNAELRKFADGKGVLWCDFTQMFLRPDGTMPSAIMPDALHPSELGYEIWASAILPYFEGSRAQRFPEPMAQSVFPDDHKPRTLTPASRFDAEFWVDKIARNRARIWGGEREFDLVMTGDSITHYWEIGEGEDDSREILELEKRYRHMNCGYGGDKVQNLIWRMKYGELDGCKVKVLAIQIGTNNFISPTNPENVARGILEAVRIFREKHPETKILLTSCFPRHPASSKPLEAVNALLKKAVDGKTIFYLDLYDKFFDAEGKFRKDCLPDGLHPSAAGYRVWLDGLVPVVDGLLKETQSVPDPRIFTAMTYNVRVGLGDENQGWYVLPDGHLGNLPQCARVIREAKPDWVAIEEIDRGTDRTGKVDQTDALAKLTGMHGVFRGKIPVDSGEYGVALLLREKPISVRKIELGGPPKDHMRILIAAELKDKIVCATHFSLDHERRMEAVAKIRAEFAHPAKPVFIGGDFNLEPDSPEFAELTKDFVPLSGTSLKTFPSHEPRITIDYVFVDRAHADCVTVEGVSTPETDLLATDHRPVVVRYRMKDWKLTRDGQQ